MPANFNFNTNGFFKKLIDVFKAPQEKGPQVTNLRTLSPFTGIDCSGAMRVQVSTGREQRVEIVAETHLLEHVRTIVSGGTLRVFLEGNFNFVGSIKVFIQCPSLDKIDVSGAVRVIVDKIDGKRLDVDVSGAGNVTIENGSVAVASFDVSGAGNIDAKALTCDTVKVECSGAGNIRVTCTTKADADVSGAGTVSFHGKGFALKSRKSGVGTIRLD